MTTETPTPTAEAEAVQLTLTSRMTLRKLEGAAQLILKAVDYHRQYPTRLNEDAGRLLADAMLLNGVLQDWDGIFYCRPDNPDYQELPFLKALQYYVDLADEEAAEE